MGFCIKYNDIRMLMNTSNMQFTKWQEQFVDIRKKLLEIVELSSFKGKTADAVKAYILEIHNSLIFAILEATADFQSKILLYSHGYYNRFDSDKNTVLSEDALENAKQQYLGIARGFGSESESFGTQLRSIRDLIPLAIPDADAILDNHATIHRRVDDLKNGVGEYERNKLKGELADLESLIGALRAAVNEYEGKAAKSITNYSAGDYASSKSFSDLSREIQKRIEFSQKYAGRIGEAIDNETRVIQEIEKELVEQRKNDAIFDMIVSGLIIVAGVAAIVLTAGLATPLVVGAFVAVAGGGAMFYGASNLSESMQSLHYANQGDPYTSAFNPIRDTVFSGNQMTYDIWGNVSLTACALITPAAVGIKGAQAAGTHVGRAVVTQYGKSVLSGGAGYLANAVGEHYGLSKEARLALVMGTGLVAGFGLEGIDKHFNISGFHLKPTNTVIASGTEDGRDIRIKVVDGKVGGKVPVNDYEEIRAASVKNPNTDSMTLGKYTDGPDSYIAKAGKNSSYFDLGDDWAKIQKKFNLSDKEMFEYFNKPAIDDAIASGKQIQFSHNPCNAKGYLGSEWSYIKKALCITDDSLIETGGVWYVK